MYLHRQKSRLRSAKRFCALTRDRGRGVALILVLGILSLVMVLILGLLTSARVEFISSNTEAGVIKTRQLSEIATNLVVSQLRQASAHDPNAPSTWISQPGAARRYGADGKLLAGYKLYSDSTMIVDPVGFGGDPDKAELEGLVRDAPEGNWNMLQSRYVDLNEPTVRDGVTYFPIADPRAFDERGADGSDDAEGFSYTSVTAAGGRLGGTVLPGGEADKLRLPMPVEWLYVLEDGTLGNLDSEGRFQGSKLPTVENPITGRVAFWADDECAKINVNSASEPTYWNPPHYFHFEDYRWAIYQPAHHEFQRYPGHPSTTALSPVLFPNKTLSWPDKETIYDVIPKIGSGGSKGGSQFYTGGFVSAIDLDVTRTERLFASLDELTLAEDREENSFGSIGSASNLLNGRQFFLTADSNAPETNQFGLPRISIWPVAELDDDGNANRRTAFDQVLAFCSSLGPSQNHLFHFQRSNADSQSYDINISRNRELLSYLTRLTDSPIPGFGEGTFAGKYGKDRTQILVEMFDYVRSSNLFDDLLTDKDAAPDLSGGGAWEPRLYANRPVGFPTFTDPRFQTTWTDPDTGLVRNLELDGYPGHGQVIPSLLEVGREKYRGFGRMHTLSEVAVHFVCCADAGASGERTGGVRAEGADQTPTYFSNFPPHPEPNPVDNPGLGADSYPYGEVNGISGDDPTHPGYDPANWNYTLDRDEPLENGMRRVQATVLLEWFCPSSGWTLIHPEFSVKVSGLGNLKLNGQRMFPDDEVSIKTYRTVGRMWGCHQNGGKSAGFRSFIHDRRIPARGDMLVDWGYNHGTWGDIMNYDMVSDYIDIEGTEMDFSVDGPITVTIFNNHTYEELIQTIDVRFPGQTTLPVPELVTESTPEFTYVNWEGNTVRILECLAPRWWGLNFYGCLGRQYRDGDRWRWQSSPIRGRFWRLSSSPVTGHAEAGEARWRPLHGTFIYGKDIRNFRYAKDADVVQSMMVRHGDHRLVAGRSHVTEDVFVPHRHWGEKRLAHSLSHHGNSIDPGSDNRLDGTTHDLVRGARYPWWRRPDFPLTEEAADLSNRYGDFDSSVGSESDGAFINKPDEGNTADWRTGVPYLFRSWLQEQAGATFFSPNRQLPSPGMFGSLPSGIHADDPWRTLLFRPQLNHPGSSGAMGGADPPDHLLLDLFWMPVVEPYVLSDPFSTRGKVNMNYQILPFTNIRRATGMHAVMKNEMIASVKPWDALDHKRPRGSNFWMPEERDWYSPIDIDATLDQFDQRFAQGKAFKSASELCAVHLIPEGMEADSMEEFWKEHAVTSDNLRERPYTNIYPRLTTRSNAFRVHMRCQTIRKARSVDPTVFDPDKDFIVSDYRGSTLISRFITPDDPDLPDYATDPSAPSLESFHEYRVINQRRFAP